MTTFAPPLVIDVLPRCWQCGRLFAERLTRPWRLVCTRCAALNDVREAEAD